MVNRLVFLMLVLFLVGCTPRVKFNRLYSSSNLKNTSCTIIRYGSLEFYYSGNLEPEFGSINPKDSIETFLCSRIAHVILKNGVCKSVTKGGIGSRNEFDVAKLPWESAQKPFAVRLPKEGSRISDAAESDIVLMLLSLKISSSEQNVGATVTSAAVNGAVGLVASAIRRLDISCRFVYWDNREGKPVAWGNASGSAEQLFALTKSGWQTAFDTFANELVAETPFLR